MRYSTLFEWLSGFRAEASRHGYVTGPHGRKYLSGLGNSSIEKRKKALDAHPVILVLYDAARDRAFWLDVQAYCDEVNKTEPHRLTLDQETVTTRIPVKNKLTLRAVDYFRSLSLSRMN